ncbi:MAG TPA: aminopeptidase, partial [Anaerolineales bacterium]|nr:aminopeptidase [Anaerolineales bacterium]
MDDQEFNQLLEKYAEVVVKVGLNLRNDQHLSIRGNVDDAPFIRKVAETAYKAGARYVDVLWDDENIKRTRLQ